MECPFCAPLVEREHIRARNALCYWLQHPTGSPLPGSGMILPWAHRATVFDLTAAEWAATWELVQLARATLDVELAPQGYNLGWNSGSVGGQEVFHAHLHILPRFADEPLAGRGIRYWLKQPENRRPE